jgi:hypothetical protein
MTDSKEVKLHYPRVHHVGVVVKDLNKAIKDAEGFGVGRFEYPSLPGWLEKRLFKGKTFDTKYKFLGMGPFIHPKMYTIIEDGPELKDPSLPPLAGEALYRGKPFTGSYKIFKVWLGDKILELVQPIKGDSPWMEHLESRGEGFHHVAFDVDNLDEFTSRLIKQGATRVLYARLSDGIGGDYLDLGHRLIVEIFHKYY